MKILKNIFLLYIIFFPLQLRSVVLDLEKAVIIGLKNNKQLKIAQERLKSAEANIRVARSSFFPSIEAQGTYTYLGVIPEAEMISMSYIPQPTMTDPYAHIHTFETVKLKMARENNYEASFSIKQPIFMWGKLINNYKFAKIQYEIEKENYKKTKLKVIRDIKNAFYSYLLAQKSAELMEESYNQLKENVKSAEINYKSGIITRYDFMAISVQLANLEPSVSQAKNNVIIAKQNLKNVLGLKQEDIEVKSEFNYKKVKYDLSELKKRLLQKNPDLKILSLQKNAMKKLISITKSANKPSLLGIFNYKYKYIPEDEKAFGESEPESWSVTIALSIPISEWFPWSKTVNEIEKSHSNYKQTEISYEQLKDALTLRLKQVYLELITQYKMIESQKKNIENAKETYEFRKKQYKSGFIKYTELIDSQVALTKAETNYLQAVFKYIMAKVSLDELLGFENREEF